MCGNGIRCLAKYIRDCGLSKKSVLDIETGAGLRQTELLDDAVRVDMGPPRVSPPMEVETLGRNWRIVPVSMGNPHGVLFWPGLRDLPIETIGPALERHPAFPDGINVEFVEIMDRNTLRMRVWERGSGETLACGTGACAALAAAASAGLTERTARVELTGGTLEICWDKDTIFLTGPAVAVYKGEYLL